MLLGSHVGDAYHAELLVWALWLVLTSIMSARWINPVMVMCVFCINLSHVAHPLVNLYVCTLR